MPRPFRAEAGLIVVGLGTIAAPLDTAVNIAFPSITSAFALGLEDIRWVVIAYVLTYASLMLACGRLGDLVGYRPIFQLGLLLSALGLAGCAMATSFGALLVGRMLQGLGIALTLSCGPALAISLLGEDRRTGALAFYAGVTAAGSALGPLVGGLLVQHWGWAAVFWFRVPLALLALSLSWLLPATVKRGSVRDFDVVGAILLVGWMTVLLLLFAVLRGPFGPGVQLSLALLSLVFFAAFLMREMGHPHPLIRLSLFADARFAMLNLASIAVNLAAFGVLILVPYYLVGVAGFDVGAGGAVLAAGAGGAVVGASLAARLAPRLAVGRLAFTGLALTMAGLWSIAAWSPGAPLALMGASLLVQGIGLGLFQVAYADYVVATLPVAERGVAGSLTMVTRTIGVVLGASGLSTAFAHFEAQARAHGTTGADAFLMGFQATFQHVGVGLALCIALGLLLTRAWRGKA
jgi:MFS family permease